MGREALSSAASLRLPLPVDAGYFAPQSPEMETREPDHFHRAHEPSAQRGCGRLLRRTCCHWFARRSSLSRLSHRRTQSCRARQVIGPAPGRPKVFADVPDIRPHIAAAAVVVAPLRYGSGARQKILEAWSMEKCVVATTVGAEGLE